MDRNLAYNIGSLFTSVFGVSSPVYLPWGDDPGTNFPKDYRDIGIADEQEPERLSWMGTPVLGTFTFDAGSYKTYDGQGKLIDVNMPGFILPYACLVDFSKAMNVTKTKVLGNAGTVKEIYGLDDWNINIRGFCLTDKSRKAQKEMEEQMDMLVKYRTIAGSINVTGKVFNNKDINAIVIEDLSLNPIQGKPDVMPFTIRAVSDKPIELLL